MSLKTIKKDGSAFKLQTSLGFCLFLREGGASAELTVKSQWC